MAIAEEIAIERLQEAERRGVAARRHVLPESEQLSIAESDEIGREPPGGVIVAARNLSPFLAVFLEAQLN
jgi:hypothetical protein